MDPLFYTTADALLPRLGTADAPHLIDVCVSDDVAADSFRLPGADRIGHRDLKAAMALLPPDAEVVVVCQKGQKLSLGMAAALRARGLRARALEGGVLGWGQAGLPRIHEGAAAAAYVVSPPCTAPVLLTVWLLRRWIAPRADILWVPPNAYAAVADRFDAVPLSGDPRTLADTAGLGWPPLSAFLSDAIDAPNGWAALLRAPQKMHKSPEAAAKAALPLIDAAWTALRKDIP
ncbi:MAG: rhodanese-like domain-containing protein [Pseudomonadota bacterium]